jgi:hypothetical protein
MSHDQLGPHERRLRELREERIRKAKGPRKLIPYAGKDYAASRPSEQFSSSGNSKKRKKKT